MSQKTHQTRGQVQREAFDTDIEDQLIKACLNYLRASQNESCMVNVSMQLMLKREGSRHISSKDCSAFWICVEPSDESLELFAPDIDFQC